jgi:hypothetical protein
MPTVGGFRPRIRGMRVAVIANVQADAMTCGISSAARQLRGSGVALTWYGEKIRGKAGGNRRHHPAIGRNTVITGSVSA